MASITRRITAGGETRYDVRLRLGDRVQTKTFRRRSDADRWARQQETRKEFSTQFFVTRNEIAQS